MEMEDENSVNSREGVRVIQRTWENLQQAVSLTSRSQTGAYYADFLRQKAGILEPTPPDSCAMEDKGMVGIQILSSKMEDRVLRDFAMDMLSQGITAKVSHSKDGIAGPVLLICADIFNAASKSEQVETMVEEAVHAEEDWRIKRKKTKEELVASEGKALYMKTKVYQELREIGVIERNLDLEHYGEVLGIGEFTEEEGLEIAEIIAELYVLPALKEYIV